jgi:monofunctional biosynthetic peptidoglycan transglycosylase
MSPLFDFGDAADSPSAWRTVNDTVMGGVSESAFVPTDDGAAFCGTVSLEHGGGFASVRAPEGRYDLTGATGVRLRVRGDGKRYNLTLYTRPGGRISYRVPFTAPEQWANVGLSFDALTPYRRGRRVPNAPPFDPSQVRTLGILIADQQAGPFRLDLRRMAPYRASS